MKSIAIYGNAPQFFGYNNSVLAIVIGYTFGNHLKNMFPSETRPYIDESVSYDGYPQNAEKVNGRWAMIGFVALLGAYVTTGQIIPGFV